MQVMLKSMYGVGFKGFGNPPQYIGVNSGEGFPDSISADFGKTVVTDDTVYTELTVYAGIIGAPRVSNTIVTVQINGINTSLSVTLGASNSQASITGQLVTAIAGDDISYTISGPNTGNPGYTLGCALKSSGGTQFFGLTPLAGSVSNGNVYQGGAFGNGELAVSSFANPTSNTYSICGANGSITKLGLKPYTVLGAEIWTAWIRKNGILQDGSGGTVDTSVILSGTDPFSISTFALPVVVGDILNVVLELTGDNSPFANAHVAVGVGFVPTVASQFMSCGGSNDVIDNVITGWNFIRSKQLDLLEVLTNCPTGQGNIGVLGLYCIKSSAPGVGKDYIQTIRKNGADTAATVTISDLAISAFINLSSPILFSAGDVITLQTEPVNTPVLGQLHWGITLISPSNPGSGLYVLTPSNPNVTTKRNDTVYLDVTVGATVDNKIPNPFAKLAYLGE